MKNALRTFTQIVTNLINDEEQHPVASYVPANKLFERLDLSLPDEPITDQKFHAALKDLVLKTPRTATNAFFNQLFGGRNEKAILGDLLAVILNNSMYTYKAAGPQVGVEKVIISKVCEMIGWSDKGGGTFAAGGSMTNLMGMLMARDASKNTIKTKGFQQEKLTVYTSRESHYSVQKNAAFVGIGRDSVRFVEIDDLGKIDTDALIGMIETDKKNGYTPSLINLTAGTTVLGAFDPIPAIAEICEANSIWLHVDGAYCGSVLFSKKYKHLIRGIEKVDSFSFNAHKMLSTPLSCSLLLVKDEKQLYDSFSNEADYLYQTDHDEFNLGKSSLQCGRRNDALKFWTLWKSVGTKGLEVIVDRQFELADYAREYIRGNDDYTLYSFDDSVSVCFNYKNIPARLLCTQLYEKSKLLVGYGSFKEDEFVRLVTVNAQNSTEDIFKFFKVLENFVTENPEILLKKSNA